MGLNRKVIIGVVILMVGGAYQVLVAKKGGSLTKVIVGGYVLAIIASVVDLAGGPGSQIAGLLIALAVGTVAFAVLPDLMKRLGSSTAATSQGTSQGGGGSRTFK